MGRPVRLEWLTEWRAGAVGVSNGQTRERPRRVHWHAVVHWIPFLITRNWLKKKLSLSHYNRLWRFQFRVKSKTKSLQPPPPPLWSKRIPSTRRNPRPSSGALKWNSFAIKCTYCTLHNIVALPATRSPFLCRNKQIWKIGVGNTNARWRNTIRRNF